MTRMRVFSKAATRPQAGGELVLGARSAMVEARDSSNGSPPSLSPTVLYLPLFAWLGVSGLTIYLYAYGPFLFPHQSSLVLYGYLLSVHLALVIGYRASARRFVGLPMESGVPSDRLNLVVDRLAMLALGSVLALEAHNLSMGLSIARFEDAGDDVRQVWNTSQGSWQMHLFVILSIGTYPFLGTVTSYWKHIRRRSKVALFVVCALIVLTSIQGGSRAGVYGLGAVLCAGTFAGQIAGRLPWSLRRTSAIFASAVALFIFYAGVVAIARSGRSMSGDDYTRTLQNQTAVVDPQHPIFDLVPNALAPSLLTAYFYFGHGYEGLALTLDEPFKRSGFGFCHSQALARTADKILGEGSIWQYCYDQRLLKEDGYSESYWMTMYPWIASDLTFPGSVVFVGVLGWWLASAWADVLRAKSIAASWVLAWMAFTIAQISGAFAPGDYGEFIGYWGSLILWLGHRSRVPAAGRIAGKKPPLYDVTDLPAKA